MAPIYDTDLGNQRWEKSEWQQVELYEQIQKREKRKRTLWIGLAVFLFLVGASITVVQDRYVKWKSIRAARELATQIQTLKTDASRERKIYQMDLTHSSDAGLFMRKYSVKKCGEAPTTDGVTNIFLAPDLTFVTPEDAKRLQLENIISTLCYDPLSGFVSGELRETKGMVIGPVNDLTNSRLDRFSTLLIDGESAEISFD